MKHEVVGDRGEAAERRSAEGFNRSHSVGCRVFYWLGLRRGGPSGRGKTLAAAEVRPGPRAGVMVRTESGSPEFVPLSHLEPVRSRFVVFAGADGCGKDEQARRFSQHLSARGVDNWLTGEPWTSQYGMMIREALRERSAGEIDPAEMAMLFALDRKVHLREVERRLASGSWVVGTRYVESSVVYQGAQLEAAGFAGGTAWVLELNRLFRLPDVTYLLEVPREDALSRVSSRGLPDAYERDEELRRMVAERYGRLEELMPGGDVVRIDGSGRPEDVAARVAGRAKGLIDASLAFAGAGR